MFEWEIDRMTDAEVEVGNCRPQLGGCKPQLDGCKPQLGHVEIVYIPCAGYIDAARRIYRCDKQSGNSFTGNPDE